MASNRTLEKKYENKQTDFPVTCPSEMSLLSQKGFIRHHSKRTGLRMCEFAESVTMNLVHILMKTFSVILE